MKVPSPGVPLRYDIELTGNGKRVHKESGVMVGYIDTVVPVLFERLAGSVAAEASAMYDKAMIDIFTSPGSIFTLTLEIVEARAL